MQFRDWLFSEMPINQFQLMGKWGEKDKPYHYDRPSIGILMSPKGVAQITRRWSNTKQTFNLYFLRGPNVWKQQAVGVVTPDWVEKNLNVAIPLDDQAISVIFTQNVGRDKIPMTSWGIAHRLGHAIFKDEIFTHYFVQELQNKSKQILREVYNLSSGDKYLYGFASDERAVLYSAAERALYHALGTMKSAREGKLSRPLEFVFELVAQYINTGRIKFNAIPQMLKLGRRLGYLRANPQNLSLWNDHLDTMSDTLAHNLDSVFSGLQGEIFVM